MSAAAWDLELDGKWQGKVMRPFIDWLFSRWQKNHCRDAWIWQIDLYPNRK